MWFDGQSSIGDFKGFYHFPDQTPESFPRYRAACYNAKNMLFIH
jgi:hypothetical protein